MRGLSQDKKNVYVFLGVLVLVLIFFVFNNQFFMSSFIKCNNYEPRDFGELVRSFENMGGKVSSTDSFSILVGANDFKRFNTYYASSTLGEFFVIPISGGKCNEFLEEVNLYPFYQGNLELGRKAEVCETGYVIFNNVCYYNSCWSAAEGFEVFETLKECNQKTGGSTSFFGVRERRQVLSTSAGLMFCNYENNLAFLVPSDVSLSNYVENYVVCMDGSTGPVDDGGREEKDVVEKVIYVDVDKEEEYEEVRMSGREIFKSVFILLVIAVALFLAYDNLVGGKKRGGKK